MQNEDDIIINEIPDGIGEYKRRLMQLDNFVVIEYSKAFSMNRFLGTTANVEDVLFESIATNLRDAVNDIKDKILLGEIVNKDFPKYLNIGIHPTIGIDKIPVPIKPFQIFYLFNPLENFYHIGIVSTNIDRLALIMHDIVKEAIEANKRGDILKLRLQNQGADLDAKEFTFTNMVYVYTIKSGIDVNATSDLFKKYGFKLFYNDEDYRKRVEESRKPDFFICHDYRDKEDVALKLYSELVKNKVKVWYDDFSLEIGDSLTDKLQEGIRECRYGILIISKHFLENEKWAKYELQSYMSKQISGNQKAILPIWHNVTIDDINKHSYWLSDKLAGNTNTSYEELAKKLIAILTTH